MLNGIVVIKTMCALIETELCPKVADIYTKQLPMLNFSAHLVSLTFR